jgi:hypothetical protein
MSCRPGFVPLFGGNVKQETIKVAASTSSKEFTMPCFGVLPQCGYNYKVTVTGTEDGTLTYVPRCVGGFGGSINLDNTNKKVFGGGLLLVDTLAHNMSLPGPLRRANGQGPMMH